MLDLELSTCFKFDHILTLRINMLTVDYEYSRSNRENLPLPIQMQLSKKPNVFCQFFIAFLKSKLNFEHFERKESSLSISKIIDSKRRGYLNA